LRSACLTWRTRRVFNDFTLTVNQELNYTKDTTVASFDLDFSGGGYGISGYGTGSYGDPAEGAVKHDLHRARARSSRLVFANANDQENVLITGWEFMIAAPYRMEFKQ
jgi:hypothetical protein